MTGFVVQGHISEILLALASLSGKITKTGFKKWKQNINLYKNKSFI